MPEAKTDRRAAPPRFEELSARAEALIPALRERAPRAEQLRRLPDETIADLHSSGLFRMLQPARVGGSELPYRALFELAAGNLSGRYYDVAPDGRFLLNTYTPTARTQTFSLMVNWPARLKR